MRRILSREVAEVIYLLPILEGPKKVLIFIWFWHSLLCPFQLCKYAIYTESKEKRGENSDFWFLGWTVRADIFGRIYLGSKKFSQMAAFVGKSKNIESSLNLNNYCQISIQLACLT